MITDVERVLTSHNSAKWEPAEDQRWRWADTEELEFYNQDSNETAGYGNT